MTDNEAGCLMLAAIIAPVVVGLVLVAVACFSGL